jgi:RNA polymerase sigma factor (TIGR02999 family)
MADGQQQPCDLTLLIERVQAGDEAASGRLMELVYDELRRLAGSYLRQQNPSHTLQATALVHEAFLRLADKSAEQFRGRAHFFAVAATAMRQILTDYARRKLAAKRGGEGLQGQAERWDRVCIESGEAQASGDEGVDIVALDDVLGKLAALDQRKHRIVELRFFGGLTVEQVAEFLGLSVSTVEAEWRAARAWLNAQLGA